MAEPYILKNTEAGQILDGLNTSVVFGPRLEPYATSLRKRLEQHRALINLVGLELTAPTHVLSTELAVALPALKYRIYGMLPHSDTPAPIERAKDLATSQQAFIRLSKLAASIHAPQFDPDHEA